ncbi:MAG: ComEC/Rec2 family competence protein, partial [Planctomycetota bacterium]|nr:ComEC/Rec2 family competence protein [Planctomycetota bacterium]
MYDLQKHGLGVHRRSPWLCLLGCAIAGIVGDKVCNFAPWLMGVAAILALVGSWALRRSVHAPRRIVALLIATTCLFALRHSLTVRYVERNSIESYLNSGDERSCPAVVRGRLVSVEWVPRQEPRQNGGHSRVNDLTELDRLFFEMDLESLQDSGTWIPVAGSVRVWAPPDCRVPIGADFEACGMLSVLPVSANPGAPSWRELSRGIGPVVTLRILDPAAVRVLSANTSWHATTWIPRLRESGQRQLTKFVPLHQQGLAAAMILGLVRGVPEEINRVFTVTGMAHIVSISGLHVGMLISAFLFLVQVHWLSLRTLRWVIGLCVLYALLTGARAPVVRACVLAQLVCLGCLTRRPPHPWNTLAGSAVFLLFARPAELFQLGTQLSFVAVVGLGWFTDHCAGNSGPQEPLDRLKSIFQSPWQRWAAAKKRVLGLALQTGLTVWCVTTPLTMWHFGVLSPWSAVINLFLAPPLFVALVTGILVVVCGAWCSPIAVPMGWVCGKSLDMLCGWGDLAEHFPLSHVWVLGPTSGGIAVFYVGWWLVTVSVKRTLQLKTWLGLWFLWMAFAAGINGLALRARALSHELSCHFFSVGHGTCVLLQVPGGMNCLYDAGQIGATDRHVREIAHALRHLRVDRLHAVFLSHADVDHFNLLEGISERVRIDQVFSNPGMFDVDASAVQRLKEALNHRRIPMMELNRGQRLSIGAVEFNVL